MTNAARVPTYRLELLLGPINESSPSPTTGSMKAGDSSHDKAYLP